jgi:acyl-coenzyme A thioesterase PaaI-like protein
MSDRIIIDRRFCGPPDSANGGYACGLVAAHVDGPAEVTLRLPPPLATPLHVEHADDGGVRLLEGDQLVADGVRRRDEDLGIDVPEPVGVADAERAATTSQLHEHPEEHPFPTCFVCGPQRAPDDGLHVLVGSVAGRGVAADTWTPATDLAGADGVVRPEFVWAALDCAGGVGSWLADPIGGNPFVLGRMAVTIDGPVRAGAPHAVVGWRAAHEGRKVTAGSAIFTGEGRLVAAGRATWIQLS